ncbi:MAG TPA: cobalamin-dependent protein [Baekduia sp.]|nr:cobalamin-dependent protein [Baekduia sp.]
MGTEVRPIRFQSGLLEELEARLVRDGGDLSHFVNAAVDRALHGDDSAFQVVPEPVTAEDLHACAVAYRSALLARDGVRARTLVDELVDRGARIIDVYTSVLTPALEKIGELWALEQVSVADEHYATEETARLLTTLAPDRRPAPSSGRLAVVGATPDELHALGARMVADVLGRVGWEVIALGAGAPADALAGLVATECPDVVALSTSTVGRLPGAEEAVGLLGDVRPRPLIVVGGGLYRGPVIDLARSWGADLVTSDLAGLLDELRERFPPAAAPH